MKILPILASVSFLLSSSLVFGQATTQPARDFPPGVFSDGGRYDFNTFSGKILVLVFFETGYATNKDMIPDWNKLVVQYQDKPIKFIAVTPHNTLAMAQKYVKETGLKMTVFADNLNIMEAEYGQNMSMNEARAFRIIGPDGNVIGKQMTAEGLDQALSGVSWKYKDKGYDDPKLTTIVNLLEWNQLQSAVKLLKPMVRKQAVTPLAQSATKLYTAVKTEGEQWKTDADGLVASDPVQAYDLYTKISTVFAGDELGNSVAAPLRKLKTDKAVVDELAARAMYDQLYNILPRAKKTQREEAQNYCKAIVARYPDTPTGKKADALATAIGLATLTSG